jgi:hypothetical protein
MISRPQPKETDVRLDINKMRQRVPFIAVLALRNYNAIPTEAALKNALDDKPQFILF